MLLAAPPNNEPPLAGDGCANELNRDGWKEPSPDPPNTEPVLGELKPKLLLAKRLSPLATLLADVGEAKIFVLSGVFIPAPFAAFDAKILVDGEKMELFVVAGLEKLNAVRFDPAKILLLLVIGVTLLELASPVTILEPKRPLDCTVVSCFGIPPKILALVVVGVLPTLPTVELAPVVIID